VGAAVVAHSDASPVFEPPEHDLDFVALFVDNFIVIDGNLAVLFARDTRHNTLLYEGRAEPVGIITAISEQLFSLGETRKE